MGSEKRKAPGSENKVLLSIPGPTAYEIPSKVLLTYFMILDK